VTDRSREFLAAERVREKLTRLLGQELPYALTVDTDSLEERAGVLHISCLIWVERPGQKAIVIGENGARLKQVGQQARLELERLFSVRVFLRLWVKVRDGWANDESALQSLGYGGG
jgi:GTP-binding protein Era